MSFAEESSVGNRVNTTVTPRIAAQQPPPGQHKSAEYAQLLD